MVLNTTMPRTERGQRCTPEILIRRMDISSMSAFASSSAALSGGTDSDNFE